MLQENTASQITLKEEINSLVEQVDFFVVNSPESFITAANELIRIKQYKKRIDAMFNPAIKQAYDSHKAILATKKQFTDPVENAEITLNKAIRLYNVEQKRIADEERKKAEEEAKKFEEAEKQKLIIEANENLIAGKEEEAKAILEQAEHLRIAPRETNIAIPPMVEGLNSRITWKARIVNAELVPIYFGSTEIRPIDQSALNKIAKESKGLIEIPGVQFYEEEILIIKALK